MDKKITRRVVLGTIIGGLAAGPFIIRGIRQRGINVSDSQAHNLYPTIREKFFAEWDGFRKKLLYQDDTIKELGEIPMRTNFDVSRKYHYSNLETVVSNQLSAGSKHANLFLLPECTRENISFYREANGTVMVHGKPENSVEIQIANNTTKMVGFDIPSNSKRGIDISTVTFQQEGNRVSQTTCKDRNGNEVGIADLDYEIKKTPEYVGCFSLKGNGDSFTYINGNERCDIYEALLKYPEILPLIMGVIYPYPKREFKVGDTLVLPESMAVYGFASGARCDAIVNLRGHNAVKITSEKKLNSQQYQEHIDKFIDKVKEYKLGYEEELVQQRKQIATQNLAFQFGSTHYISVENGLTLRRESYYCETIGNAPPTSVNHSIYQLG